MLTQDVKNQIIKAIVEAQGDVCVQLSCGLTLDGFVGYEHEQRMTAEETRFTPAEYEVRETYTIESLILSLSADDIIWEASPAEIKEFEQNLNQGWI